MASKRDKRGVFYEFKGHFIGVLGETCPQCQRGTIYHIAEDESIHICHMCNTCWINNGGEVEYTSLRRQLPQLLVERYKER
jgi:hypothetical protein